LGYSQKKLKTFIKTNYEITIRNKISEIYLKHLEKVYPGISECKTMEDYEAYFANQNSIIFVAFNKEGDDTIKIKEVPK